MQENLLSWKNFLLELTIHLQLLLMDFCHQKRQTPNILIKIYILFLTFTSMPAALKGSSS
jgi:hypothetical protein